MTDKVDIDAESARSPRQGEEMNATEVDLWFVREVLPLEATLLQYLHHHWRDQSEVADLCQDVYVRVYERAREELPSPVRPFVFAVARNLLIDRLRHEQVVPIEAASDVDALSIEMDEPGPDRTVMARDTLRRVMDALDRLPPRARDVVVARQLDGLSRRQIAERMGISEETVKWHLATGMNALADLFYAATGESRRRK